MAGELIVLFNSVMNVLLLKFTIAVTGIQVRARWLWLSACCSAVVTAIFSPSLWSSVVSFCCLLAVFPWRLSTLFVQGSWLMIGTLLAGGFLTMLQPMFKQQDFAMSLLLFVFLTIGLLFTVWQGHQQRLLASMQQAYVTTCEFMLDQEQLVLCAYIDTGNECREPLSLAPVHFVAFQQVKDQLSKPFCAALGQWRTSEPTNLTMFSASVVPLIRFVRIRTVQQESQLVLAFRLSQLTVDGRHYTGHYVVFTQNEAPFPQQTEMILHVCILLTK